MLLSYYGWGIAHEQTGLPCQDALVGFRTANGTTVLAISDGATEAKYALTASKLTVQTVAAFFERMTLDEFLAMPRQLGAQLLLEECFDCLVKAADDQEEPDLRHYSATLVFAVIGPERILVGNLGDGCAVALDEQGNVLLDSCGDPNKGRGNVPTFTISESAEQNLRLYVLDRAETPVDYLVLTSDGPTEMLRNRSGGDLIATVRELWGYTVRQGMTDNAIFEDVIEQMAEVPLERMDDWSMLIWGPGIPEGEVRPDTQPHSMLHNEVHKRQRRLAADAETETEEE